MYELFQRHSVAWSMTNEEPNRFLPIIRALDLLFGPEVVAQLRVFLIQQTLMSSYCLQLLKWLGSCVDVMLKLDLTGCSLTMFSTSACFRFMKTVARRFI